MSSIFFERIEVDRDCIGRTGCQWITLQRFNSTHARLMEPRFDRIANLLDGIESFKRDKLGTGHAC